MEYRPLTRAEVDQLISFGCRAEDWGTVETSDPESLKYIRNVRFSGTVRFGKFEAQFTLPGGLHKHAGIRNATLHNVTIGDNSLVENVTDYIANYDIGHDTYIENVDLIFVDGNCSFGNGVEVSVLNETGGREVKIYDRMSAQIAYVLAMYRHRPGLIARMNEQIEAYAREHSSERGTIGDHVTVRNTCIINGVRIGDGTRISGASRLKNGSINSNMVAPVTIGYGVIADDFIICSGSKVEDNTTLTRCFVGQSCTLGHAYSASDSLFFSNCQGENGEACAIFAGPFTVTHHKSTLLIAGKFSFMNAGSGSNQSNHMYKLGPIHQGILERGAKTASDSYILWPSRIGAFSLVMGRHVNHSDTTSLSKTLNVGLEQTFEIDFGFVKSSTKFSMSSNTTWGNATTDGWTKGESTTKSETVSETASITLPPYTTAILEQATGRIKWFQILGSAMSLACLPIGWVLYRLGAAPVTILYVYIAYTLVYRVVELVLLRRMMGFRIGDYLAKAYLKPLAVVAVMALYLFAYHALMPAQMGFVGRVGGIALTFVVACAAVFGLGMYPWERHSVSLWAREKLRK